VKLGFSFLVVVALHALAQLEWRKKEKGVLRSLVVEVCASGYTLGPNLPPAVGRSFCTFIRLEDGGGGRVGYLRAVFEADNLEAVFAALEVELPILKCQLGCFLNLN